MCQKELSAKRVYSTFEHITILPELIDLSSEHMYIQTCCITKSCHTVF